ncbi:MAG: hypothetical protein U9N59_16825 [Campylobacterota bacterium]|nr:hypothetical protein [Campylobacterota bacterium]
MKTKNSTEINFCEVRKSSMKDNVMISQNQVQKSIQVKLGKNDMK